VTVTQTRRERIRFATIEEIKSTAWKQVADQGAASLSLRAIAREMGMTAPGLYRYYKDRDALVTALLMDAFDSFSDSLETARDKHRADDHIKRFRAITKAYFQWATGDPQKYLFLFGTPIPGYEFAPELGPSAQRSFLVLQGVVGEAYNAGKVTGELTALRLPTSLKSQYEALKKMGMPYAPVVTHLALSTWSMMHGMTSLFLYGYFTGFVGEQVETYVDFEIEKMVRVLGLE
jgi:AcrR family transcriptional regulator